jgi:hypothetical protein
MPKGVRAALDLQRVATPQIVERILTRVHDKLQTVWVW